MLNQNYCKSAKLIVCILARGQSQEVLETLDTAGKVLASEYASIRSQNGSLNDWVEMDSLRIVVTPKNADSVFELLYHMIEIDTIEGAYMYQTDVPWITAFELPVLPKEGLSISSLQDSSALPEGIDEKTAKALRDLVDLD